MVKKQAPPPKRGNPKAFYLVLAAVALIGAYFLYMQMRGGSSAASATTIDPSVPLPKAEGYLLGNADAPVQVVEYADFECPVCAYFATITEPDIRKRLVESGQISLRYMHYHIPAHPNTWQASMAAACANEQGKFWEMHDAIYNAQDRWAGTATRKPKGVLKDLAGQVRLNVSQWETCFDTQKYQAQLLASQQDAEKRQVRGTPTFIIGSKMIDHNMSYDQFKAYVDTAMASAKAAAPNDSAAKKGS
ncbi:MAG TPA: thioredoxin domain-containing protein [Gemmatimonadaceae bacterium]|jgi:protein-disulfide isomerase|nr:thioredoxin domain-containing protein [Gemmatimonadaceae bacterium]